MATTPHPKISADAYFFDIDGTLLVTRDLVHWNGLHQAMLEVYGVDTNIAVSTPFNVSLHDTDCVSCGACVQVCPTGSLMMAERYLDRYAFALDRCIFCGDCVEVCPHGALGETPNFELSFFNRFGPDVTLEKSDLAKAPTYLVRQRLPRGKKDLPVMSPLVRPLAPRGIRE